ncbi:MAG: hypothetical protein P4M12_06835 [Gammaproteobacteria bacterium]|nr:hypothetical protein [Gammaproteobacteria bacterium]
MQQIAKDFAERLNKCLDELNMPVNSRERSVMLSKMLDIPKQQAWSLIEGQLIPNDVLLQQIADELEVETDWLQGKKK